MADVDVAYGENGAQNVALVANTVKTVGFARDLSVCEVANFGGSATVYAYFVDPTAPRAATVDGKHCFPVFPNSTAELPVRTDGNTLVSLISSAATTVWVNGT